ncbi:MAG: Endoribonuclease YbeY [Phycisphaerae bacterium]|nr:Endoribonuclease YbeY [Phycisphaerae bacterium]
MARVRHAITIASRQRSCRVDTRRLERIARGVMRIEKAPPAEVEIALVADAEIARINRRFLNHRGPTDVISFDLSDDGRGLVAQIVVSVETARRQAESRGHSTFAEAALYVTHGLLHQLGYDDHADAGRRRMHARQTHLLAKLGVRLKG